MPQEFDNCVKNGGRVVTVTGPNKRHRLKEGEYVKYCMDDDGSHRGYVQKKGEGEGESKGEGRHMESESGEY